MTRIFPGDPLPLGCSFDGIGANISVFSEIAEAVEICLFDDTGAETRLELPEHTGQTVHGYLPDISPGQRYGFRVHGPWNPDDGLRCNPNKLLLDPYARAVEGSCSGTRPCSGTPSKTPTSATTPTARRSSLAASWSTRASTGTATSSSRTPWSDTIIYEAHVKGATMLHPDIETELRGTYARHRAPGVRRAPDLARRHRARAAAGPPVRPRRAPRRARPAQLLGLQLDRLLRAAQRVRPPRSARRAGAGLQADGQGAAQRRHRGDPRRRLQPHCRGQPPRPDAVASKESTTPRTTAWSMTTRATTWTTRAPATA